MPQTTQTSPKTRSITPEESFLTLFLAYCCQKQPQAAKKPVIFAQYRSLLQEIHQLEAEKQQLAAKAQQQPELTKALYPLAQRLAQLLNLAVQQRLLLEESLAAMQPSERILMRARYLQGQSWEEVATLLYGEKADFDQRFETYLRTVYRRHQRILAAYPWAAAQK